MMAPRFGGVGLVGADGRPFWEEICLSSLVLSCSNGLCFVAGYKSRSVSRHPVRQTSHGLHIPLLRAHPIHGHGVHLPRTREQPGLDWFVAPG